MSFQDLGGSGSSMWSSVGLESKLADFHLYFQLRSALDKTEELEVSNGHLVKRLEKMKASRSVLLSQQWRPVLNRTRMGGWRARVRRLVCCCPGALLLHLLLREHTEEHPAFAWSPGSHKMPVSADWDPVWGSHPAPAGCLISTAGHVALFLTARQPLHAI